MSTRWLLPAVVLASVLLLGATSNHSRPNQHKESATKLPDYSQNEAQRDKEFLSALQSSQAAFLLALSQAVAKQTEAATIEANAQKETLYSVSILIQAGLLLVGIVYSIFAGLQWNEIQKGNETTRHSFEVSQQAVIGVKRIEPALRPKPKLAVVIENFGKIASPNFRASIWGFVSKEGPKIINLNEIKLVDASVPTENEMMPNVEFTIPIPKAEDVSPEQIVAIENGAQWLYVVGPITHDNGFGADRTIHLRWYYDPVFGGFVVCPKR